MSGLDGQLPTFHLQPEERLSVNRMATQLADGREIFFYDDEPHEERLVRDRREISRPEGAHEIRYDPLLDEWVALAGARQNRTHKPSTDACPLCPTTPGHETEVPAQSYDVAVFENRFPSFNGKELILGDPAISYASSGETFGIHQPGSGRCEVICFDPNHDAQLADVSAVRMHTIIDAWADRTHCLLKEPGVEQVFIFENRGEEVGVTLHHPHGQIYGYPFVTPRTERMLRSAKQFQDRSSKNLFAQILDSEQRSGARIIRQTDHFTAFTPYWARWPVEVHIYPHRHIERLPDFTHEERADFAGLYLDLLQRCDQLFTGRLPYISTWHQAPKSAEPGLMRTHLQLFSIRRADNKLKYLAGSESGMDVFINDISPEDMAARLRELGSDTRLVNR